MVVSLPSTRQYQHKLVFKRVMAAKCRFKGGSGLCHYKSLEAFKLVIKLYAYWLNATRRKMIPTKFKELAEVGRQHPQKIGTSYGKSH